MLFSLCSRSVRCWSGAGGDDGGDDDGDGDGDGDDDGDGLVQVVGGGGQAGDPWPQAAPRCLLSLF